MIDLLQNLITTSGGSVGVFSVLSAIMYISFSNRERATRRHIGLCMALVDKGLLTNEILIRFGAVDDPREKTSLKEILT